MKKFMLSSFSEFNRAYCIVLGNRTLTEFGSKRDARYFLAEVNRFLDKQLIELNLLYSEVFVEYRKCWLVTANIKSGKKRTDYQFEENLQKDIDELVNLFNRVGNTSQGLTSSSWSFIYLQKICNYLSKAAVQLYEFNKRYNYSRDYYTNEILIKRIKAVSEQIEKFPGTIPKNAINFSSNR